MTRSFRALLMEGLRKFAEHGYASEADLQDWMVRLHAALEREMPTDDESRELLSRILEQIYTRDVGAGLASRIPGVSRYTIDRVAPQLRAELDRRIYAGADLIRLNKRAAVEKTLQRFAGWASSVPKTGTTETSLRDLASDICKPVAQVKFEARRVAIDQGHKLMSAVAHVVSVGHGAIAAVWHDRGEFDHGYDARPEHLKRSGKLFLVRDSWAMQEGLIRKPASVKFSDEIEQPAELPYCSCYYEYISKPNNLPRELLTGRGLAWVSGKPVDERHDSIHRAGNYRKGHIRVHGLEITIETNMGQTRTADDKSWSVVMPADYGYIRRTIGADDEQIDCFIGPNPQASRVWVIAQGDPASRVFDEQKVMLGFNSREQAVQTYERGFSDGRGRLRVRNVFELTVADFKNQIFAGRTLLRAVSGSAQSA